MSDQAAQTTPVVVVLQAEIDVTNSELVHDRLMAAATPGVGVVIADMTSTTFCDSSGVHAVILRPREPPPRAASRCAWPSRRTDPGAPGASS